MTDAQKQAAAELTRDIADAVGEGRRPVGMAEDEEIVYDVLGVAGYYALLAMVMNVARTAVPEGSPQSRNVAGKSSLALSCVVIEQTASGLVQ